MKHEPVAQSHTNPSILSSYNHYNKYSSYAVKIDIMVAMHNTRIITTLIHLIPTSNPFYVSLIGHQGHTCMMKMGWPAAQLPR